jgi:hypothetical protein
MNKKNHKENHKKFKPYPEITSPDFYQEIYEKKEFRDYEITESDVIEECGDTKTGTDFNLSPFQSFLKNYINIDTPYNGILVMYSTGVGKTCAAISIAEGFKKTLKQIGKRILVITTLKKNFENELFNFRKDEKKQADEIVQCTGREYELSSEFKEKYIRSYREAEVKRLIRNYYQFFGYQKFANYVMKMTQKKDWDQDQDLEDKIKKFINKEFDDRVIIIDEVHNIKTDVKEEWKKSIQPILLSIVKYAKNTKLILMSATPMFDRPDEIIFILNLLLANDGREMVKKSDIFNRDGTLTKEAYKLLPHLLKGYVSYARGEKPMRFPFRLNPRDASIPIVQFDMSGKLIPEEKRIQFTKIIECTMESIQNNTYLYHLLRRMKESSGKKEIENEDLSNTIVEEESNSNEEGGEEIIKKEIKKKKKKKNESVENIQPKSLLNNLTYISIVTYPTTEKMPGENKSSALSIYGSFGKQGIDNTSDNGKGGFYKVDKEVSGIKTVKYRYQEHAIIKQGSKEKAPFMDEIYLDQYSTKFAKILHEAKNSKGTCFIYSFYVDDGILPLALMLEQNGFKRECTTGETDLLDIPLKGDKPGKRQAICYHCGKTLLEGSHQEGKSDYHKFYQAKYIMYFGDAKDIIRTTKEAALEKFTSPTNKDGQEIKLFLGTKTVSEGLDFKRIRQVHILEPWYNLSRHEQIIGRAIRNCSHMDLPMENRNVEIFQYAAILNPQSKGIKKGTETVDLKYYRFAEDKDRIIKKITRILKESAVDCNLFKNYNVMKTNKKIKQITASGQELMVSMKDEPFSPMCDYEGNCDYQCSWKINPHQKYPINTDTYNLRFGTQDINIAKKLIKDLFKHHNAYHLGDIENNIHEVYPKMDRLFIYAALDEFINSPKQNIVIDKFKRKGIIIYRGDYYIFQPNGIRDDLPMIYREKPLDEKPYSINLQTEVENINYNIEQKNVSQKMEHKANLSQFEKILDKIKTMYRLHEKILNEPKYKKEYQDAVYGIIVDKLSPHAFLHFMITLLTQHLKKKMKQNMNKPHLFKDIDEFLDYEKNNLISYQDIVQGYQEGKSKKIEKETFYIGFQKNGNYYILKKLNDDLDYDITKLQPNYLEFVKCNPEIIRRLEQKERIRKEKMMEKKYTYNPIRGVLSFDEKTNEYNFKIVDETTEKKTKTIKGEESIRSRVRGQVCKSYQMNDIRKVREKLNMYTLDDQPKRDFLCEDIELYLRYMQGIQNKIHSDLIYFLVDF